MRNHIAQLTAMGYQVTLEPLRKPPTAHERNLTRLRKLRRVLRLPTHHPIFRSDRDNLLDGRRRAPGLSICGRQSKRMR